MRERIDFQAWGSWCRTHRVPAYAMRADAFDSRSGVVARAIARAAGCYVITVRSDGTAVDRHGRAEAHHFEATMGHPCPGGGYNVAGRVWFSIPAIRIARIHDVPDGWGISDDELDYLETGGPVHRTKAEALRAASADGYTHAVGSGCPWSGVRRIPERYVEGG